MTGPVRVDRKDVLMYVNSLRIVRTLPPDAQDEAIRSLREGGYYSFWGWGFGHAGHGGFSGSTLFDSGRFGNKPIIEEEFSPEETEAIHLVWRLMREKGKTLHIVDVGKESGLRRLIEEHLHHLRRFPVLVRPDGRRVEGTAEFTPEKLEAFLSD